MKSEDRNCSFARKPIAIYYVVRIQTRNIHSNADAVQDRDMIIETEIRPLIFPAKLRKVLLNWDQ